MKLTELKNRWVSNNFANSTDKLNMTFNIKLVEDTDKDNNSIFNLIISDSDSRTVTKPVKYTEAIGFQISEFFNQY